MTLKETIEKLLEQKTQFELAEELGVRPQTILIWRRGSSTAEKHWELFEKLRQMTSLRSV